MALQFAIRPTFLDHRVQEEHGVQRGTLAIFLIPDLRRLMKLINRAPAAMRAG